MSMTALDIDPAILADIRANSEPVIVDTEHGWRRGVRGRGLYGMGHVLGRMTITDEGEVYHSMLGSRPTYTKAELERKCEDVESELDYLGEGLESLNHA